ncbi:MAG: hypothetical protein ACOH2V_12865 [Candidatus Saccharimonadaceae bacterium]
MVKKQKEPLKVKTSIRSDREIFLAELRAIAYNNEKFGQAFLRKSSKKELLEEDKLTAEQIKQIKSYPVRWQSILLITVKKGEPVDEVYQRLSGLAGLK